MKKILIVMPKLDAGGAERSLINFLEIFDREKYTVDLLLFKEEGSLIKYIPHDINRVYGNNTLYYMYNFPQNIKDFFFNIKYISARLFFTLWSRIKISDDRRAAEQFRWKYYSEFIDELPYRYNIALAYLEGEPLYYIIDKVKADRKIGWVHNDYLKLGGERGFDEKYFNKADTMVTISPKCIDVLRGAFPEIEDKFVELPNINSAKAIKQLSEEFYPEEYVGEKKIILSIGRLEYQKGFDLVADIVKKILIERKDFVWFIIGDGSLKKELNVQIQKAHLEENVQFIGPRDNPYPYIKHADLIVQPSRYEGKSVVLDETKILHKEIVVTNYDTVYDQVADYPATVVEFSVDAIASAILQKIDGNLKLELELDFDNKHLVHKYYEVFEGKGRSEE